MTTQHEQVIAALESNGGYATLGKLYQLVDFSTWATKTPHASVRRIVQQRKEIFKIRPGLWALEDYRDTLPPNIMQLDEKVVSPDTQYTHYYYQGLLLEIGNMRNYDTFVPAQDKNQLYLETSLGHIAKRTTCYDFTYDHVVRRARTIDVIWFNRRQYPAEVYEVEHSTDFQNSLIKFVELQDFNTRFWIVADKARKRAYEDKISASAFESIKKRVQFLSYDKLSMLHSKTAELHEVMSG
ncbi:MAG: hypothetical protein AAFQ07_05845 [Chloroflexota bacterium]